MRARALGALVTVLAAASSGCFGPAPNVPPSVHAASSSALAAVGEQVVFTGTALDPDGSIVRFEWDFESDGIVDFTNATRGSAIHVYTQPGNFTARFTATDDRGATASATVDLGVMARFTVTADWGSDEGYLIHAPAGLDPASVAVTVTPSGAPAPFDFRTGTGLAAVNSTIYRVSLPLASLGRYSVTRVGASYNGTPGGERLFRATPYFGSENDTAVVFDALIHEQRGLPDSNASYDYRGSLASSVAGTGAAESFDGTGASLLLSREGGSNTTATYTLLHVAWNNSVGRDNGTFSTVAFEWTATGTLLDVSASGFTTNLSLTEFAGRRFRGDLTFERAQGEGTFGGGLPGTTGTASYTLAANATLAVTDGNGIARNAIRVLENLTLNGTYGGANYTETNLSERWVADSDAFVHTDIVTSWNSSGRLGTTNLSSSGGRYLDSDGDGVFNPDARPAFASDGQYFHGLAPADLEAGDAFTVRNVLGASARLVVGPARTEVLVAQGFAAVAVLVVTVAGPVEGGGFIGSLTADVVADGPHGGLRLSAREQLELATSSFASQLTLSARGA